MHNSWLAFLILFFVATSALDAPLSMPGGQLPHYRVNPMGMSDTSFLVPELTANPTKTASSSTSWSSLNAAAGDIVVIDEGVTITISSTTVNVKAIGVKGTLIFDPNTDIQLTIETLFVYDTGRVVIKPSDSNKHTITFDGSINTTEDPAFWGLGFVTVGGNVEIVGKTVTPYARLTRALAGENYITIEDAPVGWNIGDEIVLAGADGSADKGDLGDLSYSPRYERISISSIDGTRINLNSALQYSYNKYTIRVGNTDYDREGVYGMVAHVTRNVLFQTASNNYEDQFLRGHFIVQLNTTAVVQYTAFHQMGRTTAELLDDTSRNSDRTVAHLGTNPRGRYALHAHMLRIPFDFTGNAIYSPIGNQRWGITMHDTIGTLHKNVVIFHGGAAIATELATESGTLSENLSVGVGGGTGELDPTGGRQGAKYDFGHGGMGYWISGNKVTLNNNIADGYFQASAMAIYLFWYGRGNQAPIVHDDDMYPVIDGSPLSGQKINLWEPIETFNGFTSYAFTFQGITVGEAAGVVPYVFEGVTLYHGAIHAHGHGGYIKFKNFKVFGEGFYTAYDTDYLPGYRYNGATTALNYVLELEDGSVTGFSGSFSYSYHAILKNVQFLNVISNGSFSSETQLSDEARLLVQMDQVTFLVPPLPSDRSTPPPYTAVNPDSSMTINYPVYGDTIPVQDVVTVVAQITPGSKTVQKVEFYLDDTLVDTVTAAPYTTDLAGPLSYAKHVLRIEATFTDGAKLVNPQHVFYTVPSRDTTFHKGWNMGGPTATYQGNTYDAMENPGGNWVTDRQYNPNDRAPTDDAELATLLETSVNLPAGESNFMTVTLDGIDNGVYHMYSHWVASEPLGSAITSIVQDVAVAVAPGSKDWNQYVKFGPIPVYINDNNSPLDLSATVRNNGNRLSLCAVELRRVMDPAPGTQPVPLVFTPTGEVSTPGNNNNSPSSPNSPGARSPSAKGTSSGQVANAPIFAVVALMTFIALF